MKLVRVAILAALCCMTVKAEDWTVNGKTFHNVTIGQVEADRVHITFDGGIGSVMLADLTPELQKRFNFDPQKAALAKKQREDQRAQSEAALAKDSQPQEVQSSPFQKASGTVLQVLPTGFLASISTSRGYIYRCFVKSSAKGLIDGQQWSGTIEPFGTFSYTDEQGGANTVAQFTDDPKAAPVANSPVYHNAQGGSLPPKVSYLQSVGGG